MYELLAIKNHAFPYTYCIKMSKRTVWVVEVTPLLNDRLDHYIDVDSYKTKSEFIRVAVRDKLSEEWKTLKNEQLPRLKNTKEVTKP